jgi:D-xylose reductase
VGPLKEPVINDIAKRLGKSPAQVILRWNLQRGVAVIPKCSKKERILENMSLFDFELTDADMEAIKGLNKNLRFNDPGYYFDKKVGGPLAIFN